MDVTYIRYTNETNYISMNDDDTFIQKYYAPFLSSNNHEDASSGSEYDPAQRRVCRNKKSVFDLLLNK